MLLAHKLTALTTFFSSSDDRQTGAMRSLESDALIIIQRLQSHALPDRQERKQHPDPDRPTDRQERCVAHKLTTFFFSSSDTFSARERRVNKLRKLRTGQNFFIDSQHLLIVVAVVHVAQTCSIVHLPLFVSIVSSKMLQLCSSRQLEDDV